ncbi:MAG TPA: hypothetical protein VFE16_03970 [Candidatus Cybelea sp.]|jgi:hypothetical protein|nr:hypothetical protein [Candidatus Cybelea sp.]
MHDAAALQPALARRHWIPPLGLAFGQLCHGLSWILALWIALRLGVVGLSLAEIGWIHLVALGWLTMTALSILLHAIPSFLDVSWRFETAARYALVFFGASVAAFVFAFLAAPTMLWLIALAVALTLLVYLVTAAFTLGGALRSPDRITKAVARAFAVTFLFFFIAIVLGAASAWIFSELWRPTWLFALPPAHGSIALFGWLTLLIYGVSARTLRPMTGNRSQWPMLHIVTGTATLIGAVLLAGGAAGRIPWLAWLGGGFLGAGALAYATDVTTILSGATVTYRVPQCFIGAAVGWLGVALALGAGVLAGMPWLGAFGFVMLAGWAGQMVNGHIFRIGVRLIATISRGDDDETQPSELLDTRGPWIAFGAMQLAITCVTAGLVFQNAPAATAGAALGLTGWFAIIASLVHAWSRAGVPRPTAQAQSF